MRRKKTKSPPKTLETTQPPPSKKTRWKNPHNQGQIRNQEEEMN